jgi:hypothetical protein
MPSQEAVAPEEVPNLKGLEATMKTLLMLAVMGLALSATGFGRDRDDFKGRSNWDRNDQFSGRVERRDRDDRRFDRDRYVAPVFVDRADERRDFRRDYRFDDRDRRRRDCNW